MNIDVDKIVVSLDVVTPDAVVVEASAVAPSGIVTEAVVELPTQVIVISHEETPTVTSLQIIDYGSSSIECAFDVTTEQAEEVVKGVLCGTTNPPTFENADYRLLHGQGSMDLAFAGLLGNTEYYLRPYALSNLGYKYGDVVAQRTKASLIPDEYQLVEYLGTSGNYDQYINSGIDVKYTDVVIADWIFLGYNIQFGARLPGTSDSIMIGVYSGYFIAALGSQYNDLLIGDTSRHKFTLDAVNRNIYIDDILLRTNTGIPSNNLDFYLFARNGDLSSYKGSQRAYQLSIIRSGNKIRDFYPVYRKADNKPGMYDIVNNVFYTNAGTGEFIVGPDKEWEE